MNDQECYCFRATKESGYVSIMQDLIIQYNSSHNDKIVYKTNVAGDGRERITICESTEKSREFIQDKNNRNFLTLHTCSCQE